MSLYFRAVVYPWYNTVPGRDDVQRNVSDHAYSTVVMMSKGIFLAMSASVPVSYTHLTLPTILLV